MQKNNHTIFIFSILIIVLFSLLITGCGKGPGNKDVLASVGSDNVTVGSFNERVSNLPERYQKVVKRQKREFLERLINDILLHQEARRKGLHKNEEVLKVIEEAEKKILIARLLKEKWMTESRLQKKT
jgi:peptidyl-prolyl cis-trans isomerase C